MSHTSWLKRIVQQLKSSRQTAFQTKRRVFLRAYGVEPLECRLLLTDFGDAPSPFPVTIAENGARHTEAGPTLGATRDGEPDGTHSAGATADGADETGVTFGTIRAGALAATATVNVAGAPSGAKLDAWIDFNGDGNWGGPGEQVAKNVAVVNGNNAITFDVPSTAKDGTTFARFRLSAAGNLSPEGLTADGEVEDYAVTITPPDATTGVFGAHNIVSTDAVGGTTVIGADLDGDGDMDMLSSSRLNSKIAWYENDGNQNFTEHLISDVASGANSVFAADVDGDGDLDVLSASQYDDKIAWYENDGSQNFTEHAISTAANGAWDVKVADVDGDGDVDVLSASYNDNKIAWYENDGTPAVGAWTAHTISTAANRASSVFTSDVDGDGDLDVLSASRNDDKIAWYENDGSQNFTARTISTAADFAESVFAVDVDGDGDMDVISGSATDDKIAWYENDGSQNFTAHTISTAANSARTVFAADMDGDGDVDALSASQFDQIDWYENDGSQNFSAQSISTTSQFLWVSAADVDGDGDLDVLSASYDDNRIVWYENINSSLTASITGGDLTITDTTGQDNDLSISVSGSNLIITDTNEAFDVAPPGGLLSNANRTLTIPSSSVTGSVIVHLAGGINRITVATLGTSIPTGLIINGGTSNDTYRFDTDAALGSVFINETGNGVDTIDFALTTTQSVTLNLGTTVVQVVNLNLSLKLNSATIVENAIGGSGSDTLTGNSLNNTLTGSGGNDVLTGVGGNDLLFGGLNDDTYVFGTAAAAEADQVNEYSNQGTDTLSFAGLTTNVVLNLGSIAVQAIHANRTLKLNSAATFENAVGGSGGDTLTGNSLNNVLTGGNGNDTLNGGAGNDELLGGVANDTYRFSAPSGSEVDLIREFAGQGTDTVNFSVLTVGVTFSLNTSAVQSIQVGRTLQLNVNNTFENAIGGSGGDTLTGNSLNNTLTGSGGNDVLTGAAGSDNLFGGLNDDTYVFGTATAAEADLVHEYFDQGTDSLSFSALTTSVVLNLSSIAVQTIHSNRTLKLNSAITFENIVGGSANDTLLGNTLNNRLTGGNGHNILVGLDGSDLLESGTGRDVLIGGRGLDTLTGGSADDLLIAGRTTSDTVLANLTDIQTEWISGNSYATRITNLRAGVGGSNVSLMATINVLNDAGEDDSLTGGAGTDWYLKALDDVITDLFAGEITDVL